MINITYPNDRSVKIFGTLNHTRDKQKRKQIYNIGALNVKAPFTNVNVGALVVLYDLVKEKEIDRTVTNKYGIWEFELNEDKITDGTYEIRYHGSGTIQKLKPFGDWERFDVVYPIEPLLWTNILPFGLPTSDIQNVTVQNLQSGNNVNIEIFFDDAIPQKGKLKRILVEYKVENFTPVEWKILGDIEYKIEYDRAFTIVAGTIPYYVTNMNLSVRCSYYNGLNQPFEQSGNTFYSSDIITGI